MSVSDGSPLAFWSMMGHVSLRLISDETCQFLMNHVEVFDQACQSLMGLQYDSNNTYIFVNSTFSTFYLFVLSVFAVSTITILMKFGAEGVVGADKIVTPKLVNLVTENSLKPAEILYYLFELIICAKFVQHL